MAKFLPFFTLMAVLYAPVSLAIIGGAPANGSLPQVINLRFYKDSKAVSLCTGTIVGEKTIMTAAHCIVNEKLNIFETDSRRVELDFGEKRDGIFAYAIPSKFKKLKDDLDLNLARRSNKPASEIRALLLATAHSDVALIYTREKISLSEGPMRIASEKVEQEEAVDIAGFGLIEEGGRLFYPHELHRGKNKIFKKGTGVLILQSRDQMPITSTGDSGGPLLNRNGAIIGVLSGGGPFGSVRESFYVDLSDWQSWLQARIR